MRSSLWPVAILLAALAAGCTGPNPPPAAPPRQTAAAPPPAGPVLSPGCPLGAVSLLGLNPVDQGCQASAHVVPPGPVGMPNLP
jgi:hypothetical protein